MITLHLHADMHLKIHTNTHTHKKIYISFLIFFSYHVVQSNSELTCYILRWGCRGELTVENGKTLRMASEHPQHLMIKHLI